MNLLKTMRYIPKHFGVVAAIIAAAVVPAALMAWGPDRPTFTVANPATYVTFNSITDNPVVGDERNFVVVKDAANTQDGGWQDDVTVQPGKEYLVRVYVHNNANANLNLKALNTRVSASVPTTTGKSVPISGFVSADNATPQKVYDDINFKSDKNFNLAYVPGSAVIYNNGYAAGGQGKPLPDSIVTSAGAQIGYNAPNGEVPGCFQFANYVYFKVKPQFEKTPNFEVAKTVSKSGANTWGENINAAPGELVDFRIRYKNTGETQQDNVVVKDQLPSNMTYVANSTKLYNALNPNGKVLTDDLTTGGINIGSHSAGASSFVVFTARVVSNDKLPVCGNNIIKNIARVETDNGSKEDDATVTVPKECLPQVKYACDALTVTKISRTQFEFKADRTVQNAEYVRTVFIVRDANGTEITRVNDTDGVYTYTRSQAGAYSVEAQIVVKVNGVEKVATSANCKKNFEVVDQPVTPVYECVRLELIKKARDTYEFKTTAKAEGNVTIREVSIDFGDNQKQTVDYGKNATYTYKTPGNYTAVATVSFTADGKTVTKSSEGCKVKVVVEQPPVAECKPGIPVGDKRCEEVLGTTAPVTPGTPEVIASTGPATILGGLFGSSALGLGFSSYVRSRRALRDALNKQ